MEVACQSLVWWCAQLHRCDSGLVPLRMRWNLRRTVCSEEKHLYLACLKASCCVCLELKYSGKPFCCQDVNWELLLCCPCFQRADTTGGMYTICMRGPFPWLLQWRRKKWLSTRVTITNSYFSDYWGTIQLISRYTPLFLVLHHEAILPLLFQPPWCFSASGTVMWTAALQLNTWTPAFGIRSKQYSKLTPA